jgi:hypothetical protein
MVASSLGLRSGLRQYGAPLCGGFRRGAKAPLYLEAGARANTSASANADAKTNEKTNANAKTMKKQMQMQKTKRRSFDSAALRSG